MITLAGENGLYADGFNSRRHFMTGVSYKDYVTSNEIWEYYELQIL
jgi:hypothetical protein